MSLKRTKCLSRSYKYRLQGWAAILVVLRYPIVWPLSRLVSVMKLRVVSSSIELSVVLDGCPASFIIAEVDETGGRSNDGCSIVAELTVMQ